VFSVNTKHKESRSYKTTGNSTVLCISIFTILEGSREGKRFRTAWLQQALPEFSLGCLMVMGNNWEKYLNYDPKNYRQLEKVGLCW
jgi:hypothetical protein